VLAQAAIGPNRSTGTEGGRQTGDYIVAELEKQGWEVEEQQFTYRQVEVRNLIGRLPAQAAENGDEHLPLLLLGAHYDTRRRADQDPDPAKRSQPVPGANDGASGVAVLLELARNLDRPKLVYEPWLAFFDAEDNGHLDGWQWAVGSAYMAEHLTITPTAVIVVDMVGDADQQIYYERNSDRQLMEELWRLAAQLGYRPFFIPQYRHAMFDDHTPFLRRGIPAVDIIDFDYPYWHTTADTPDKISPASLERIGRVLETFLEGGISTNATR